MSLSKRANLARGRYARWQRRVDRAPWVVLGLVVLTVLGRLVGVW